MCAFAHRGRSALERKDGKMRILIIVACLVLATACTAPVASRNNDRLAAVSSEVSTPNVRKEVAPVTYGHWRHFGVIGSVYRDKVAQGTIQGALEEGVLAFKTLQGPVWFAVFEPNNDRSPLTHRRIYLVHVSDDLCRGCGYAMEDFRPTPAQCVIEEKILSWQQTKYFFNGKLANSTLLFWEDVEKFLLFRQWK